MSLPTTAGTAEPGRVTDGEGEAALKAAIYFYQSQIGHDDRARAFLGERGINDESAHRWQLGYAPASWDRLIKALHSQHIPDEILLETGLAGRARTGRLYDRMRGRIVFPIHDAQGSPRGFAGRLVTGDGPRYLNSPETPLYKKSSLLYGLHLAQPAIATNQEAVIVEGYTDAIAAHQAGITHTVATGGTALTDRHLEALRSVASTVTLAFDGDPAGLQAAERVADLPKPTLGSFDLHLAHLPDGTDPAGLVADGRADVLQAALINRTPLLHHLIDRILARYDLNEVEATARALHAVSPLVERLSDPPHGPEVIRYLASHLDRGEQLIRQALDEYSLLPGRHPERERCHGMELT